MFAKIKFVVLMLFVSLTFSACSVKSVENDKISTLKECQNEEDKIKGCVEITTDTLRNTRVEIPYKDGKTHGILKEYYESGALSTEIPYSNGKADTPAKFYYENGKLQAQVFRSDENVGLSEYYDENGKLTLAVEDKNFSKIKAQYFHMSKNLNLTAFYKNDKIQSLSCSNGVKPSTKSFKKLFEYEFDLESVSENLEKLCKAK